MNLVLFEVKFVLAVNEFIEQTMKQLKKNYDPVKRLLVSSKLTRQCKVCKSRYYYPFSGYRAINL